MTMNSFSRECMVETEVRCTYKMADHDRQMHKTADAQNGIKHNGKCTKWQKRKTARHKTAHNLENRLLLIASKCMNLQREGVKKSGKTIVHTVIWSTSSHQHGPGILS
jgi:hypothetical protein